jgi:hypothetical protein
LPRLCDQDGRAHFQHDWPIFYHRETLRVLKREVRDGLVGERDAAGLYAHVMLQAWHLTADRRYLDEAEAAASKLTGLGFGTLYQTNNTILTGVALARLWKATGNSLYRELSFVCMASGLSHLWMWEPARPGISWSTVGQELYGVGVALILATRTFHRWRKVPFMVWSAVPLGSPEYSIDGKRAEKVVVRFRIFGAAQRRHEVRIIPNSRRRTKSLFKIWRMEPGRRKARLKPVARKGGHLICEAAGDSLIEVVRHRK